MGDKPSVRRPKSPEPRNARGSAGPKPRPSSPSEVGGSERRKVGRLAGILMCRGERYGREGDHAGAAHLFELASGMYEFLGEPLRAGDAVLELGRSLVLLGRPGLLGGLGGRLENLAREQAPLLPPGGRICLRVWSAILRRAEREPIPLFQLASERRRLRRRERPAGRAESVPPVHLGRVLPRVGDTEDAPEVWELRSEEGWFERVIDSGSAATRIEKGERLVALARAAGCRSARRIEVDRVVVRMEVTSRSAALVRALRQDPERPEEKPS